MLDTLGVVDFPQQPNIHQTASLCRRKIGGKSLLEWVVRRVTEAQQLDGVIVVLGDSLEERQLSRMLPPDVPIFVGNQDDPLARFAAALREFPAKSVIRVAAENPFIDPELIDRLVVTAETHPGQDYVGYCSRSGRPAIQSKLGVFAEWCCVDAVMQANREAVEMCDRWEVSRYIYSHPETFSLRLVPMPHELDREDLRLTVDVDEDWEHAHEIIEALGADDFDWQQIAGLLDQQPVMRERMAVLNRAKTPV